MLIVLPCSPPQNVLVLLGIRRTRSNKPPLYRVRSSAVSAGWRPERKGLLGIEARVQPQSQWFWAGAQELVFFMNAPGTSAAASPQITL